MKSNLLIKMIEQDMLNKGVDSYHLTDAIVVDAKLKIKVGANEVVYVYLFAAKNLSESFTLSSGSSTVEYTDRNMSQIGATQITINSSNTTTSTSVITTNNIEIEHDDHHDKHHGKHDHHHDHEDDPVEVPAEEPTEEPTEVPETQETVMVQSGSISSDLISRHFSDVLIDIVSENEVPFLLKYVRVNYTLPKKQE